MSEPEAEDQALSPAGRWACGACKTMLVLLIFVTIPTSLVGKKFFAWLRLVLFEGVA